MDSTLKVMRQLDKASNNGAQSKAYRRAEKDIKQANNALIKMDNYTKKASNAARDGERAYSRMGSAVSSAASGMEKIQSASSRFLQSLASGVYLAKELANTVDSIMTNADTTRSQVARLGMYNTSDYTNKELYGHIYATAMNSRSNLTDTADLVNKLLISGAYTGPGAPLASIETAGIINKALVAGGGTSEENQRALRQLTQGLASGVLQGDELRSIREQTPYFAQVLAEGLSKVDKRFEGIGIGDLKELGAEGELTSKRVIKAMLAMQDEINADFKSMPKTFGQAKTALESIGTYFLGLLSDADGPLGKINEKLWQFVDYLQSSQGQDLMEDVASGMSVVATVIANAMQAMGDFVVYLQNNAPEAEKIFTTLGIVAAGAGAAAAVEWLAAVWPILLILAVVYLLIDAFTDAGYTIDETIGGLAGGIYTVVAVVWDAILFIIGIVSLLVAIIVEIVLAVVWVVIFALQIIGQAILWIILSVWTAIEAIGLAIATVFMTLWGGIQTVLGWIWDGVYEKFSGVLDMLYDVASAIDAVFGTNFSSTVNGFKAELEVVNTSVSDFMDAGKTFDSIGDMWTAFGERTASRYTDPNWTIIDKMGYGMDTFFGAMGDVWDWTNNDFGGWLMGGMMDPSKTFGEGSKWGEDAVNQLRNLGIDIDLDLPEGLNIDLESILQSIKDGTTIDGGQLDGITSDVSIDDEDLQLLRDMAARDYLLQLQTITPVANVSFGDVRETADVNRIVEVIEQMVDEQMATALVS
jgi:tape measure domain-containing protein